MTIVFEHPVAAPLIISAFAILLGIVALDAERIAHAIRSRRRRNGRGGWVL